MASLKVLVKSKRNHKTQGIGRSFIGLRRNNNDFPWYSAPAGGDGVRVRHSPISERTIHIYIA